MHGQGIESTRHTVIPRVLIFIYNQAEVLLLKGSSTKRIWPGLFNGIGGHLEPNETIYACAQRELKEESGLQGITLDLCGVIHVDTANEPGILLFVFKGDYGGGEITPSAEGNHHWINLDELHDHPVVPDLHELLPRVTNWVRNDPVLYGRYYYSGERMITQFS